MGILKYSEVIGLPVLSAAGGKKIGVVEDLFFSPQNREVKALLLERPVYEVSKRVLIFEDITTIGKDAVIVRSADCRISVKKTAAGWIQGYRGKIRGLRAYSKAGEELGDVKDILFDSKTGLLEGVEVSDGLYQDIVQGRKILPLFGRVEFSEENILVDREAVDEMMRTGGGIKKKFFVE